MLLLLSAPTERPFVRLPDFYPLLHIFMFRRVLTGIAGASILVMSLPVFAATDMYDRVCPRVINRFSDDQKMWDRVNERIQNRFGFVCERQSMSSSSFQTSSKKRTTQCTSSAWSCSPFNTRCVNGVVQRDCYLLDIECLNPDAVKPQPVSCAASSSSKSFDPQSYLDTWDKSLEKLLEKAKGYTDQKNAEWCLKNADDLENEMVLRYNEFVGYLNMQASFQYQDAMNTIIKRMDELMKKVDASPTVCF